MGCCTNFLDLRGAGCLPGYEGRLELAAAQMIITVLIYSAIGFVTILGSETSINVYRYLHVIVPAVSLAL